MVRALTRRCCLAACCFLLPCAFGQDQPAGSPSPSPAQATPAASPSPAPSAADVDTSGLPAKLDDFAWMVGEWTGKLGEMSAYETWSAPRAGVMMGSFQLHAEGRSRVLEFMVLRQAGERIELRFRHFNDKLTAFEEKEKPLIVILDRHEGNSWSFRNPYGDRPTRVTIHRPEDDRMSVEVETMRAQGPHTFVAEYTRAQ
jgi:hypothetical protein